MPDAASEPGAPKPPPDEVVLDLRQCKTSLTEVFAGYADEPTAIVLKGVALDAAALDALEEFVNDNYGAPPDSANVSATPTPRSLADGDEVSNSGGSVGQPLPSLDFLDLRGVRPKDRAVDTEPLLALVRRFACGGLINRLGIGPSIVSLALLRAGMSPLLDLSADWAAAEAAQILDDPSSEDDSSSACAAAAAGLGPSVFGPCPQLVADDDLMLLATALHPFTFAASDAFAGRVGVPLLVAVRLRGGSGSSGEGAWLPLGGLGCEKTVRTLLRQRVGLVQRLRTAARPAKRRPTLSGANDLEQEQNHDDYEDEAILLKATATRLLEQLHQWLHSSKLRLLDVFRSHAKHARSDGDHKGGSEDRDSGGGGQDDDVLDEDEAIALFAGAQSVMQFENVTEDDARALVAFLDRDGDRQLGYLELEQALRIVKRGEPLPDKAQGGDGGSADGHGAAPVIDEETAHTLQAKLKAATYGSDPLKFFAKFDADKAGTLDVEEFRHMVRIGLRIAKDDVSDVDLNKLVAALDDDGGGTLDVAELADFVERGVATFGDKGIGGGGAAAGKWSGGVVVTEFEKQKAKERKEAARKKPAIPEEVVVKLQKRFLAASYGTDLVTFFGRFDKDKGGSLDATEFKSLVRRTLKMPPTELSDKDLLKLVNLLDDEGDGNLEIDEIVTFVEQGSGAFKKRNKQKAAEVAIVDEASPREPYDRQPPHPPLVWNHRRHGGTAITLAHAHASVQHTLKKGVPGYRVQVGGHDKETTSNSNNSTKDSGQDDKSGEDESNEVVGGDIAAAAATVGGQEETPLSTADAPSRAMAQVATLLSPVPIHHAVDFGKLAAGRKVTAGGSGNGPPLSLDDLALLRAMVSIRSASRLKQLEEDAAAAAADIPPSSPAATASASGAATSSDKNASPHSTELTQKQRNIALVAPAGVSSSVPVVGWRPSGAVTRLDLLRAISLSSCPIDGTAFGWTAAAAALGAFLLDPALAEPDGMRAAAASGGGGDSQVLSLTTAALSPPLLGCSAAYGGETPSPSSSNGSTNNGTIAPTQSSALKFGDLLLLDLRGCFHPPHGGVSASTLSPLPKAALDGDNTDGSSSSGNNGSGQPAAESEGGGSFLARQRGAVFVGLRLASLAVACLENGLDDEAAADAPESGVGVDHSGTESGNNVRNSGNNEEVAVTEKTPEGTALAISPSAPAVPGSENVANTAESAATTDSAASTAENIVKCAPESTAPAKPIVPLPEPVSISLVPVDFRVVVELHLPRSNLGPLEAGLLAGLLSHIWNTDKQYSDGEASVSRPASASPQSHDDISGNNGSMSRSSNSGGMSLKVLCLAGNPLGPVGTTCLARAVAGLPLRYPFTGGGGYSGGGVFNPRGGSAAIPGNMRAGGRPIDPLEANALIQLDAKEEALQGMTYASLYCPPSLTSLDLRGCGCDGHTFRELAAVLRHNHVLKRLDVRRNHPATDRTRGSSVASAQAVAAHVLADALLIRHEEALFGGGGSHPSSVDSAKSVPLACAPIESLDGLSLRRIITRLRRPYPANQVQAALAEAEEYHKRAKLTTKVAADASAAALDSARATAADLAARSRLKGEGDGGGDKGKDALFPPVKEGTIMLEVGSTTHASSSPIATSPEVKTAGTVLPESKEGDGGGAATTVQDASKNIQPNEKEEAEDDASELLWLEEGGVLDDKEDALAVIARLTAAHHAEWTAAETYEVQCAATVQAAAKQARESVESSHAAGIAAKKAAAVAAEEAKVASEAAALLKRQYQEACAVATAKKEPLPDKESFMAAAAAAASPTNKKKRKKKVKKKAKTSITAAKQAPLPLPPWPPLPQDPGPCLALKLDTHVIPPPVPHIHVAIFAIMLALRHRCTILELDGIAFPGRPPAPPPKASSTSSSATSSEQTKEASSSSSNASQAAAAAAAEVAEAEAESDRATSSLEASSREDARLFKERLGMIGRTFRLLRYGACVVELSLVNCNLGPDGLMLLAKELLLDRTCQSLNLSSNALCGADGGALDGLSALTGIYTPRGGKPANSTLCRLNLTHNDLGEDAALLIGRGFLQEPACCLAELDLRHNKFGGARGYIHLAYSLRSHPDPGRLKFLRTDRDLSELWLELGLEEDEGSGEGSMAMNNDNIFKDQSSSEIDGGGDFKANNDSMSLIGANDGSIEYRSDPSSGLARPGVLIVEDDHESSDNRSSDSSASSSPYSVLRSSAGDAAARKRMMTSALEHAKALASSPGAAGNVHVLKRIEVRAQFVHAHRRKVLARQAQDAQQAAEGGGGGGEGQVAPTSGNASASGGADTVATDSAKAAATPEATIATTTGEPSTNDIDEEDEGSGANEKIKSAPPTSAAAEAAAVPPTSSSSNESSTEGSNDAVVAFLPGRAAELQAAVNRFQFLLVKVGDGSASFAEINELESVSNAIAEMRQPVEPPPPPKQAPPLSLKPNALPTQ